MQYESVENAGIQQQVVLLIERLAIFDNTAKNAVRTLEDLMRTDGVENTRKMPSMATACRSTKRFSVVNAMATSVASAVNCASSATARRWRNLCMITFPNVIHRRDFRRKPQRDRRSVWETTRINVRSAVDTLQVNPSTAYRMLKDFVDLKPGDVIIQNGANSAVGRYVIQLCRMWKVKTINVVRARPDLSLLETDLKGLGADYVVTEEQLLKEFRGKFKNIKLALNCVGGRSGLLLSSLLVAKGCIVTYGAMSKQPLQLPAGPLIFKDIRAVGFWMSPWYLVPENTPKRKEMHQELSEMHKRGEMKCPLFAKNSEV
ncbi:hypothetical protein QR680_014905 [Steinernema hermaphroditum]|uniref:Alcohol dehydrogenase-like C-terminal domain-containing protein n=1 Tax=Steinernema hermaphroditum TaxID=289476 RepID=A0AA39IAF2_9BILA|nr:hypothetical protein QR680_014905 [Steinernema hermaphroditum]